MSDLIKTLKSSETGDNVYPNIKEDNIPSGAVKTAKLDDESVTTEKLGTMAVTTPKIDTGAVTTAKISDSAVTTIKLNDGAVTTAKISDGAVTSAKIGSSAVTNAKINDGAVSYDKLATALKNLIDGKASQNDLDIVSNALTSHTGNTSNPHSVTKSQVGLGNCDNTSDLDKPVSTATQTALDGKQSKIDSSHKLDADLVDDSTSTNKFTNASNLSKLSGIESGAEVNIIESISVNGTPVTPDANRNVNIATGGGGSTLYRHTITAKNTLGSIVLNFDLFSTSSTSISYSSSADIQTFLQNMATMGYADDIHMIVCTGYDGDGVVSGCYFATDEDYNIFYYKDGGETSFIPTSITDVVNQIL